VLGSSVSAFVTVDANNYPLAVAVGLIDQRLPSPRRPTGQIGYVEWLATDHPHRHRGAARMALQELLNWFDERRLRAVDVHASDAALHLYAALGFCAPTSSPMR